jgi:hypothetical protein
MMLPTRDAAFSSIIVGKPDTPVMDDAALGTVQSPLLPTMGTNVAGGAFLSSPNELTNDDMWSESKMSE